jgi:hypothetical protein
MHFKLEDIAFTIKETDLEKWFFSIVKIFSIFLFFGINLYINNIIYIFNYYYLKKTNKFSKK